MVLIRYDGSEDARAAIEHAGIFVSGQPAIVLTVWEPYIHASGVLAEGLSPIAGMARMEEFDRAMRAQAERHAEEGRELAHQAGLDATPCTDVQGAVDGVFFGSVLHAVLQHANRPVLVVPSPRLASSRAHAPHAREGSLTPRQAVASERHRFPRLASLGER